LDFDELSRVVIGISKAGLGRRLCHFLVLCLLPQGCNRATTTPATQPAAPTVASLVPAATDLIIGMGARDRLLAVSTYDDDPATAQLPRVGNYETIDWERLRSLHPSILITEIAADRQSPGFKANAAEMNLTPLNVQIENLHDIFGALDQLGDTLKEPALAQAARAKMQARLDAVGRGVANKPPVRTLIVLSADSQGVAGAGTFLDDLLKIAGGVNVVPPELGHWPSIDREKLLSLAPQAIIELLPCASPQEREQAAAIWKQLPQIPAVPQGRIYPIYDRYALLPGWHVTDLAEQFGQCLHPKH
jgi:iron complex transport system substrate-binding protein